MINLESVVDLSGLPDCIELRDSYDILFSVSVIGDDYDVLPTYLLEKVLGYFRGAKIILRDVSIESGSLEVFDSKSTYFNEDCISEYMSETGFQSFLVEFPDSHTFLLGIDLDFVLLFSPKKTGFISKTGGVGFYLQKAIEEFNLNTSAINGETFNLLITAVEQALSD